MLSLIRKYTPNYERFVPYFAKLVQEKGKCWLYYYRNDKTYKCKNIMCRTNQKILQIIDKEYK